MLRLAVLFALCQAGCATTVTGVVYSDKNRDHKRQSDEPGVAGVLVTLDRGQAVRTDKDGRYRFDVPDALGVVWVRVPDGYKPGAVWTNAEHATGVDLPIVPLSKDELSAPLTFVVAADTHTTTNTGEWDGGDLDDALAQAVGLATPPRFFTIVGDVTQGNVDAEFTRVEDALRGITVPWVPVPGNHDWYDGGVNWRKRWGPDNYSFDMGNLHVVVWDTNLSEEDQVSFFRNDLAQVDPTFVIVALGHASPTDAVADQLAALGVDYMFTGHWHANRRVDRPGMVEWGTQTLIMGSIDQSPSGYRVVTFTDGVPTVEHRARVTQPHVAVTSPHTGSCASPDGFQLLASAALDASLPDVRARIDCGEEMPLTSLGGWAFGAQIAALSPGTHSIDVTASSPTGRRVTKQVAFEVCVPAASPRVAADWLQLGGSATHTGATTKPIAPPLQQQWAVSVAMGGGHQLLGTPVVRGTTVVLGVWDMGAGDRGGLVALDITTGAERWRYQTPFALRAAPAIGTIVTPGGTTDVVIAALENGHVHAVALATGLPQWTHDAAEGLDNLASSLWAPPTVDDQTVYIGVQGKMSAIRLADGTALWSKPLAPEYAWLGSLAAVSVANGSAIAAYARNEGLTSWNTTSGDVRWKISGARTAAINSSPIIDGSEVYFINAAGQVTKASLSSSSQIWSTQITPDTSDWSYSITATPALADGRLIVPTQYREVIALDAATGDVLWRRSTEGGPLNFAHYRASTPGFPASPVITGSIAWIPHPDGTLAAVNAADGQELWKTNLGAPLVSAPAPAGDYLIAATFDGTVRAFAPGPTMVSAPVTACPPIDPSEPSTPPSDAGCCSTSHPAATALLVLGVVALLRRRRR